MKGIGFLPDADRSEAAKVMYGCLECMVWWYAHELHMMLSFCHMDHVPAETGPGFTVLHECNRPLERSYPK